jgi:hypothetical protein
VRQRLPDRKALRRWHLSLRPWAACAIALIAACGGLDPIVAPDGGADATGTDATFPDDAASDGARGDARDLDGSTEAADAASLFTCGTKVCDAKTHYCEKKGVTDAGGPPDSGPKIDAGVTEVDTCVALPPTCVADGGGPSCSCIVEQCDCIQSGDAITVTCP